VAKIVTVGSDVPEPPRCNSVSSNTKLIQLLWVLILHREAGWSNLGGQYSSLLPLTSNPELQTQARNRSSMAPYSFAVVSI